MVGFNQKRIDKFIKVVDDWYPCFEGNMVKVSLFLTYVPENGYHFVRVMVWGMDDYGLALDYNSKDYNMLLNKYKEFKESIYDKATDGVSKEWFCNKGLGVF